MAELAQGRTEAEAEAHTHIFEAWWGFVILKSLSPDIDWDGFFVLQSYGPRVPLVMPKVLGYTVLFNPCAERL